MSMQLCPLFFQPWLTVYYDKKFNLKHFFFGAWVRVCLSVWINGCVPRVGNWPSEALRGQTTHMAIVAHTMPSWANPDFHYHLRNEWLVGWLAGFVRHCLDLIRVLALIYNYCSSFECAGRTICHTYQTTCHLPFPVSHWHSQPIRPCHSSHAD